MGNLSMNSQEPVISIAMTTYNGEIFLVQQLDSILNQSWNNIELIICDDGSDDNTIKIIKKYMEEYDCIKLYRNPHRLGVVKNFEKAIELCQALYIALSDQDDIWIENKLEILMHEMHKLEQSYDNLPLMVHSDSSMIDENGYVINKSYFNFRDYNLKGTKDLNHVISRCGVMGNTILMNRDLKKCILPFPDGLDVHDYWIALINEIYGKRITLHEPLVQYRIHEHNYSNSLNKLLKTKVLSLEKIFTLDFSLPYMDLHREKILETLLRDTKVIEYDKNIIKIFLMYLDFNANRLSIFYRLVIFNFVKKGFIYRLKLFLSILLTKKYNNVSKKTRINVKGGDI